jgi:hypothetical protein
MPAFEPLRYEEAYGFLRDHPRLLTGIDRVKYLPLGQADTYLSLGGQLRGRYQYTGNPNWGDDPEDEDGVFLQRYLLHGSLHLGNHVRFYTELVSAFDSDTVGGSSPIEQDDLDINQGFLDVRLKLDDDTAFTVRSGRQEWRFGSQRLISQRDGTGKPRRFNGLRMMLETSRWQINGLAAYLADNGLGVFDDDAVRSQSLWGLYAVGSPLWLPAGTLDLYYLGYENDAAAFDQGLDDERRHTLGVRLAGEYNAWDWNWELIGQFGEFGTADIRAWSLATDTGYTWTGVSWQPRLGLSANIASGDDNPDDNDLETFNPLYPRGTYFSEAGVLGPRNFFNAHLFLDITPTPRWWIQAAVNGFWRYSRDDGVYAPNGQLLRSGADSDARFVGTGLSLVNAWQINRYLSVEALYTHIIPGEFIEETGSDRPINFVELTVSFRF